MRRAFVLATSLCCLAGCGPDQAPNPKPEQSPVTAAPAPSANPSAAALSGPAMSKDELAKAVCFFTPAEIAKVLGFSVSAGTADTKMLQGYGMASCTYPGSDNTLLVTAYWIDPAQVAAARTGMTRLSGGGSTEVIAGDPDSAYLHDQGDMGSSLHYLRGNLRIQVQATSSRTPFAVMKPRLLALRRVP